MELRIQRNVDHIRKLRLGPRKQVLSSELITFGYNELRHAAVPIGQYILEIFLGTWVGSIDAETVSFAKGENRRLTPRYIFEVSITAGEDQQDQQ